jgi:hypothetical protein
VLVIITIIAEAVSSLCSFTSPPPEKYLKNGAYILNICSHTLFQDCSLIGKIHAPTSQISLFTMLLLIVVNENVA